MKITKLSNFDLENIDNFTPLNFENLFINLTNLSEISNSFNNSTLYYRNINNTGLSGLQNLNVIKNSFNMGINNVNSERVELNNFFNWQVLPATTQIDIFKEKTLNNSTVSFTMPKYIRLNNWYNFWELILQKSTILNNLFNNCILYVGENYNQEFNYFELQVVNGDYNETRKILITDSLFENFVIKSDETSGIIAIKLTENTFKGLENVVKYNNMFKNCTIYGNLPLNLFGKARKRTIQIQSLGTNISGEYIPINVSFTNNIISIYEYNSSYNKITSLSGIFNNITIVGNTYYKYEQNDPINVLLNSEYSSNKINAYKSGDEIYDLPEYYQDMFGLHGDYCELPFINKIDSNNLEHHNIALKDSNCINKLFIAPDLLYWCNNGCSFESMLENSGFEGIMPNHFISKLTNEIGNQYNFNYMLKGITIIPNKCGEYTFLCPTYYEDSTGNKYFEYIEKTNNIYVFIPEHFNDSITDFRNMFSFNLIVPKNESISDNSYNSYYIMYANSIPSVSQLEGMPETIRTNAGINSYRNNNDISQLITHDITKEHKVHFNIVFDKEKLDNYMNYNVVDNNYTKTVVNNDVTTTEFDFNKIFDYEGFSQQTYVNGKLNGFNLFNGTNFSKIVNVNIAPHLYGYIISPLTTDKINNGSITISNTNRIIMAGSGNSQPEKYSDLSCYALFNNNNDNMQFYRTYFLFNKNGQEPIEIYDWQGIKYYQSINNYILNTYTWNSEANKQLLDLNVRTKNIKNNNDVYIEDIYNYQNSFETVINIPYNESIIDTVTNENEKIVQIKVKQ